MLCFTTSCGLKVGEVYKDPAFTGTKLGCMNKLGDQFTAYVQQDLREGELGMLSRCLTTAFTIFKHHVWGEERQNYSPEELRSFLHDFFLQDNKISDELLQNLMIFKTALVGGSAESLTLEEIDHLNDRIQSIGKIMENLYPYNHILFNQEFVEFEELNNSMAVIKKTSSEFSNKIFQQPYSLESAGQLLQGISQLMGFSSAQNFLWLRAIKGFAPFILKSSSKKDVILPQEWPVLLLSMTDLLSILLNLNTAFSPVSFSQKILHYSRSFETLLFFLKNRMSGGTIARSELLKLVQNLKEENIIPEKIRYTSLEIVIDALFGRLMAQTEGDFSFGEKEFLWLENFYQTWRGRQQDIRTVISDPDGQETISEENSKIIAELMSFKPLYRAEDTGLNVYLMYPSLVEEESIYKNLSMHSFYWQVTQAVLRGYAESPDYGLTESEFGELLKDARDFVSDLSGWKAEPAVDIKNYGRTEFIAGHLMLYETEGFYGKDELFDFDGKRVEFISQREGTEFLAMTGFIIKTLKDLSRKLYEVCSEAVSRVCFMNHVLSVVQSASMPQLSVFLENITEEEKDVYSNLLFKISVVDPEQIETLEFVQPVHLRNLVFTLMYQEVTMTRYDLNENALLDKEELLGSAFQLYDGLIEHFGIHLFCQSPQDFSKNIGFVYKYIVRHLSLPSRDIGFFEKSVEAGVQWVDLWNVSINRIELAELVLSLVQALKVKSQQIASADCP